MVVLKLKDTIRDHLPLFHRITKDKDFNITYQSYHSLTKGRYIQCHPCKIATYHNSLGVRC